MAQHSKNYFKNLTPLVVCKNDQVGKFGKKSGP
jgi:hypothetical protein